MYSVIIEKTDKFVMKTYNRFKPAFVKGKGTKLYDEANKEYTDFLKRVPEEGLVDEETGEFFEKPPLAKSSKVITVTWKKPKQIKDYKENNHLDNIFNKE